MKKIKVAVLFGGPSREREISFAGGRTVYDNLDKSVFEAIPIFIDSFRQFILVDWKYIYKGSIRDFYPPVDQIPASKNEFQIYAESLGPLDKAAQKALGNKIGRVLSIDELGDLMDVAFLALHGEYGEDGQIQGLLDSLEIAYTGSGVLPCAIGIDKGLQKRWMQKADFPTPASTVIKKKDWNERTDRSELLSQLKSEIGEHIVIRPAHQGSSIGVSIINNPSVEAFSTSVEAAFFERTITADQWSAMDQEGQLSYVKLLSDIRDGIGMPVSTTDGDIYHPEALLEYIGTQLSSKTKLVLKGFQSESEVLIESFLDGKEFSCIVLTQEDGSYLALPPTEIIKGDEVFDYRSKYLPGLSRKLTPIHLPMDDIIKIQEECKRLYEVFGFDTYARIDGFFSSDSTVYLNDPNTTSGMLPSSFFFHQAAELGLNPSQLISFIIRQSVAERVKHQQTHSDLPKLLDRIDHALQAGKGSEQQKKTIGVILGGYSFERHISVESGRNIFEKLASSDQYNPIPIFLKKDGDDYAFYQIPINLLLKDNADDISDKIDHFEKHPLIDQLRNDGKDLLEKYINDNAVLVPEKIEKLALKNTVDGVFIALHGRPGEDGAIQQFLDQEGIPYNGSGPKSSATTIHKYNTLQLLKNEGFTVANQLVVDRKDYEEDQAKAIEQITASFQYPFIVKPIDDGCSSAVMVIKTEDQLTVYLDTLFRAEIEIKADTKAKLGLAFNEEFPIKHQVLIEEKIEANGADQFLEITGGLLTKQVGGKISYEIFEPSEALAGEEILSLEEKFLAGEGQNITPARFGSNQGEYTRIANAAKSDFEKVARLLNVEGYARIDAFIRVYKDRVETVVIEVNSLPGMTPATCIFHQTAINGYKPFEFIDHILKFAFEKNWIEKHTFD